MARLRDLRNTLLSRMMTSSGLADAADAAASSIVSGCDEDEREAHGLLHAVHGVGDGAVLAEAQGALAGGLLLRLVRRLLRLLVRKRAEGRGAPARRTEGAVGARARRPLWMASRRASRARTGAATPHAAAERACALIERDRTRTRPRAIRFVRASGRRSAQWRPTTARGAPVPSDPPAWRQSGKDLSRTKSVARRSGDWRVPRSFFSRFGNQKKNTPPDFHDNPVALFRATGGLCVFSACCALTSRAASAHKKSAAHDTHQRRR